MFLVISAKESIELPFLGHKGVTEPLIKLGVSQAIVNEIEAGAATLHLPGCDPAQGVVLDLVNPVSVPIVGHGTLELVVSIEQ